jgi:hypothetical protein
MSIRTRIRDAVRDLREAFEYSHLYPGARIAEQIRAEQKDYENALRDLRTREASAESPDRTLTDIDRDYLRGLIGEAEYERQRTARGEQLSTEAFWAEMSAAPSPPLTDRQINAMDAGREAAEQEAFEDGPEPDADEYAQATPANYMETLTDDEWTAGDKLAAEAQWEILPAAARERYLADRAGELAEADGDRAAAVYTRMVVDGVSSEAMHQVSEAAKARAGTMQSKPSEPELTRQEIELAIEPDEQEAADYWGGEGATWEAQAASASPDADPDAEDVRTMTDIVSDYNAGLISHSEFEHQRTQRAMDLATDWPTFRQEMQDAPEIVVTDQHRADVAALAGGYEAEDEGLPGYEGAETVEQAAAFAGIDLAELEEDAEPHDPKDAMAMQGETHAETMWVLDREAEPDAGDAFRVELPGPGEMPEHEARLAGYRSIAAEQAAQAAPYGYSRRVRDLDEAIGREQAALERTRNPDAVGIYEMSIDNLTAQRDEAVAGETRYSADLQTAIERELMAHGADYGLPLTTAGEPVSYTVTADPEPPDPSLPWKLTTSDGRVFHAATAGVAREAGDGNGWTDAAPEAGELPAWAGSQSAAEAGDASKTRGRDLPVPYELTELGAGQAVADRMNEREVGPGYMAAPVADVEAGQ